METFFEKLKNSPTLVGVRKFKLVSAAFLLSAAFVLGGWFWASTVLRGTGQPVILHFTSGEGITKVGSVWDLTGIGSFAFLVVIMNFFLALALEERDWFLGKLTAVFTLVFSILIFIGFAAIIAVN